MYKGALPLYPDRDHRPLHPILIDVFGSGANEDGS
jgi:hypothetical protein